MRKLSDILYTNEQDGGGFHGGPKFQGGAYGYGFRHQLAASKMEPGLADPAEDIPGNPSTWPAIHAQEDSDKEQYGSLEGEDVYDDRNHISPMEDNEREDLLDPSHDVEPSYFARPPLNERGASDIFYRDLPGFPAMNTLADKEDHVPDDEDSDREQDDPEEERYNIPNLIPQPREGRRGKPFGLGKYNDETELALSRGSSTDTNMFDPMNNTNSDGEELKLTQKRNKTLNRWKETDQEDRGHTNRDMVSNHLVAPQNFIKKSWGQTDVKKKLDEPDDVEMAVGRSGVIVNPVKHVPGPVDIYGKRPGYVRENKDNKMAIDKKRIKYVPDDLDKTYPKETYGTGMGQILKQYDHLPDDFGNKTLKQLPPAERDSAFIPASHNTERIISIIQTKLFEKLAKLKSSKE